MEAPPNVPFDPFAEHGFFVRSDADDRTLGVEADFQVLTVEMLRRIQTEFLAQRPLWRVVLVAEHISSSIVIYPTTIRYGSLPVAMDADTALRAIIGRQVGMREAQLRPRREHFAWVQRLLPDAVRQIGDRPFWVAGVLDNYEGDYDKLNICLLVRGADRDAVAIERPAGANKYFLWKGSPFGVDLRGAVISHVSVPAGTPFCLVPWLPPADYRGPLTIVDRETDFRFTYEINSKDVICTGVTRKA